MNLQPQTLATRGAVLLMAAAMLWSTNGVLIKTIHATGMGGWTIAALRSAVAAVFLLPFALRRWKPIAEPYWALGAVVMFTGMCASFVLATTLTTAANAIILQYTAPAWVFLLSPWIVRERAEPVQWIAFGVSMLAVVFIFTMQYATDHIGLLVSLLSGLVFGVQVVFFRRVRALDPVVLAFICCSGSGLALTPLAMGLEGWQLTGVQAAWLLLAGVVQFGMPYVLYSAGSRRVAAQSAVLIIMLEPVLNPVWAYLLIQETPHWSTIGGGGLILASVCYLSLQRPRTPIV